MGIFVADFETTTRPEDCRVWAWAVCEVGNPDHLVIGTTLDEFMVWCENRKNSKGDYANDTLYFHNLKFDSQSLIHWLLTRGFVHADKPEDRKTKTFNTSISNKGLFYRVEVIFKKQGKKINKVTFLDSMKLLPMSVKDVAKAFNLPFSKLELDYTCHDDLPPGAPLTEEEEAYLKNDVLIMEHAVRFFQEQGLKKTTIGSCALDEFKTLLNAGEQKYKEKVFETFFPPPEYHRDVKQAYRGGFTYLNPKFAGKVVSNGIVLDVNSLYPSVMMDSQLPFGHPRFFEGKYEFNPIYPLYIQCIRCQFELKPGKIPTIQIKDVPYIKATEYLTDSGPTEVVLYLTSVDLALFFEQYNVYNLEYINGWMFKSTEGFFSDYINKWSDAKIQAKKEGNHGLYLLSKLFLNSLYGKFGSDNRNKSKIPYLGEDNTVHYYDGDWEPKKPVYIPMAAFITSYARLKVIKAAQTVMDNYHSGKSNIQFVYCDTDSLHCISPNFEMPEGLEIDSTKLGAWDHETNFCRAKFLRAKCYLEKVIYTKEEYEKALKYCEPEEEKLFSIDKDGYCKLNITVAGMPMACYENVTFRNFKIGAKYKGKKSPTIVPGGVVLSDVDFTIKSTDIMGY